MKITIETTGTESLAVSQPGPAGAEAPAEGIDNIDGGGPPETLLALLNEGTEEEPLEGDELEDPREPDNGGEAPAWLVDIIEGSSALEAGDPLED